MKRSHQLFALLVLGAWAATLAPADARARGDKHPANAAGSLGTHAPPGTAKPLRKAAPNVPVRNAIGAATPSAGVGSGGPAHPTGSTGAGVVKPNAAVNAHVGTGSVSPSVPAGAGRIGSTTNPATAVRAAPSALAPHAGGINGTGMARTNGTAGTIGGPARIAGGISGTGMQKKK